GKNSRQSLRQRLALSIFDRASSRIDARQDAGQKERPGGRALAKIKIGEDSSEDHGRGEGGLRALGAGNESMKGKEYDKALRELQVDLCALQEWVKHEGLRVVVVFEGRDAAGKGGTIKAITDRVSPRVFRVVALPAPSDREKSQLYLQRYAAHLPA